jgi:hypothetical protein
MLTSLYKIILSLSPIILIPKFNLESSDSHTKSDEIVQTTIKPLKQPGTSTGANKIFNNNVIINVTIVTFIKYNHK